MEESKIKDVFGVLDRELSRVFIGQELVREQLYVALLAGGHVLLTGLPGLGKTFLVKCMAKLLGVSFNRIQFTPDLMPADVFGTDVLQENPGTGRREFRFVAGPVFTNLLLADEINRTPPKTQAALLEAMAEYHVTVGGVTRELERPFFVLATQNPVELEGTYPLPEAQLDRFLMNVNIDYLSEEEEVAMVAATTRVRTEDLTPLVSSTELREMQRQVLELPVPSNVVEYAVKICRGSRPGNPDAGELVNKYVRWGAGPRASQALILAAKAKAMLAGRLNASREDVRCMAMPVLRHRLITGFRAEADSVQPDDIVRQIVAEADR